MQEELGKFYESLYIGDDRNGLRSGASSHTQVSVLSKSSSVLAVKSNGIHSPNNSAKLTAEQLEIIRLQSENFDLRRICEQLQHTGPKPAEQVVVVCGTDQGYHN